MTIDAQSCPQILEHLQKSVTVTLHDIRCVSDSGRCSTALLLRMIILILLFWQQVDTRNSQVCCCRAVCTWHGVYKGASRPCNPPRASASGQQQHNLSQLGRLLVAVSCKLPSADSCKGLRAGVSTRWHGFGISQQHRVRQRFQVQHVWRQQCLRPTACSWQL